MWIFRAWKGLMKSNAKHVFKVFALLILPFYRCKCYYQFICIKRKTKNVLRHKTTAPYFLFWNINYFKSYLLLSLYRCIASCFVLTNEFERFPFVVFCQQAANGRQFATHHCCYPIRLTVICLYFSGRPTPCGRVEYPFSTINGLSCFETQPQPQPLSFDWKTNRCPNSAHTFMLASGHVKMTLASMSVYLAINAT